MKELWDKHKANIGLAILIVYTLSLGVATADEIFGLGLFPTKLEKLIGEAIDNLDGEEAAVRTAAMTELVQYGDFAIPQLMSAVHADGRKGKLAMEALGKITDQKLDTPEEWDNWYDRYKDEF